MDTDSWARPLQEIVTNEQDNLREGWPLTAPGLIDHSTAKTTIKTSEICNTVRTKNGVCTKAIL